MTAVSDSEDLDLKDEIRKVVSADAIRQLSDYELESAIATILKTESYTNAGSYTNAEAETISE